MDTGPWPGAVVPAVTLVAGVATEFPVGRDVESPGFPAGGDEGASPVADGLGEGTAVPEPSLVAAGAGVEVVAGGAVELFVGAGSTGGGVLPTIGITFCKSDPLMI